MASTPLTLAETASVFGEMLTFQALLKQTTDPKKRKALLASKVEDMINTVVRQIAFYTFERKVHTARKEGELTPDQINAIWLEVQGESLGDGIEFGAGLRDLLDLYPALHPLALLCLCLCLRRLPGEFALCALPRERAGLPGEVFRDAEGRRHQAPFRTAASPSASMPPIPTFWDKGLSVISGMIDELEAMEA